MAHHGKTGNPTGPPSLCACDSRAWTCVATLKAPKPKELDMSSTQVRSETTIETPRARTVDMKLEVVQLPS